MIDQHERLRDALRARGQRVTPQRLMIAAAVRDLDRHATAEQIFTDVAGRMPGVSLPTVYATLDLLEEIGLVRRVATEGGTAVYDPRTDQHHHLVCRRCGAIADVDGAVDHAQLLSAARGAGFAPDEAQVVIRSGCASCRGRDRLGPRDSDQDPAKRTDSAPSPTAPATRLVAPARTSPAAKTPGRTVSSMNGARSRCGHWKRPSQPAAPVRRGRSRPRRSRGRPSPGPCTGRRRSSRTPRASARASRRRMRRSVTASSDWRPWTATTSVPVRISIRGERVTRSTRYRDMVADSAPDRTTIRTLRACRARWVAAWPAELPPPTTMTSSSWKRSGSAGIAAW